MAFRAAFLLLAIGLCVCFASAQEYASAKSVYNGYSKIDNRDVVKGDVKCNGQAFCKVCYTGGDVPKGPMSFDTFGGVGEKLFYFFSEACYKNKDCRGFTFEKANPTCAYLKANAKTANLNERTGWVAVSRDIRPPTPNMCKGGCGGKKLLLL